MLINDANLSLVAKGFKTIYSEHFDATASLKDTLAMTSSSNASEESYGWFGQFPKLREWIGDRHVHGLKSHGFKILNRKFESTVKVPRDDIADDRYGVFKPMFQEMGRTTKQHPDSLIFELLSTGFTTECYDGQNYFDTDHPGGNTVDGIPTSVSNMQAGSGTPWFLFDLSRAIRPFVWQEREKYQFDVLDDPNSPNVFWRDEYVYGIRARANCGWGLWQLGFASKDTLNATNYAAARAAMAEFAGDRGQKLGIVPTHLIVPSSLETQARTLLKAADLDGTSNIWKDTADLIITPWL